MLSLWGIAALLVDSIVPVTTRYNRLNADLVIWLLRNLPWENQFLLGRT